MMRLSFLPGDLHLFQQSDGTYVVTHQGEQVFRSKLEKRSLAKFNAIRRNLEVQFPARELTPEEKSAALSRSLMNYKLVEVRAKRALVENQ